MPRLTTSRRILPARWAARRRGGLRRWSTSFQLGFQAEQSHCFLPIAVVQEAAVHHNDALPLAGIVRCGCEIRCLFLPAATKLHSSVWGIWIMLRARQWRRSAAGCSLGWCSLPGNVLQHHCCCLQVSIPSIILHICWEWKHLCRFPGVIVPGDGIYNTFSLRWKRRFLLYRMWILWKLPNHILDTLYIQFPSFKSHLLIIFLKNQIHQNKLRSESSGNRLKYFDCNHIVKLDFNFQLFIGIKYT